jgi:serpin B
MTMVLRGANGDTATEMATVLHQRFDYDRMDAANADVLARLKSYGASAAAGRCPDGMSLDTNRCVSLKPPDRRCPDPAHAEGDVCVATPIVRRPDSLAIANALMMTKEAVVSDAYVKHLEQYYAAEVFRNVELDEVNGWVSDMTKGKIGHIIDRLPAKGIVLVDAVYFKQAWRTPFAAAATRKEDFHVSPKSAIKTATMHQRGYYPVLSRAGFRAIRLPYSIGSLSMVVVLPDTIDGATALAQRLDASELAELFAKLGAEREVYTDLSLPRLSMIFAAELKSKYQRLGMVLPFAEDRSDFSGMTGRPKEQVRVWIDDILHRATLDVTEGGSEAAAATESLVVQVVSTLRQELPLPKPFTVDRPFLIYITDDSTGAILFAGRVSDPSKVN